MVQRNPTAHGAEGLERLNQWIIEPEDHFNTKALESLQGALED